MKKQIVDFCREHPEITVGEAIPRLELEPTPSIIKLEGRLLLYGVPDFKGNNNYIFSKECKIIFPGLVPFIQNFEMNSPIGVAKVIEDDKGLLFTADVLRIGWFYSSDIGDTCGVGGFYKLIKTHCTGGTIIIDEASLSAISFTLAPVNEAYVARVI